MTKKAMAATGLFGAIAVAGAVGLLMSGGGTMPRRIAKKGSKVASNMSKKAKAMAGCTAQG